MCACVCVNMQLLSLKSKRGVYTCMYILTYIWNFGRTCSSLLAAIITINIDVLDTFYVQKWPFGRERKPFAYYVGLYIIIKTYEQRPVQFIADIVMYACSM